MKEVIFRFIWGGILAFAIIKLWGWIDTRYLIHEKWFFPDMLYWLECHNIVLRKVVFWVLTIILALSDIGKSLGNLLLILIGVVGFAGIAYLAIELIVYIVKAVNGVI